MEKLTKNENTKYCHSCGEIILKEAVVCPHCGVLVGDVKELKRKIAKPKKYKAVAVLLAIFLGYWAWLYTFGRDKIKFWILFSLDLIFSISLPVLFFLLLANSNVPNDRITQNFIIQGTIGLLFVLWLIPNIAIRIWAIINTSIRDNSFYQDYYSSK